MQNGGGQGGDSPQSCHPLSVSIPIDPDSTSSEEEEVLIAPTTSEGGASPLAHYQSFSITVDLDPDRISELETRINARPKLLRRSAGRTSCCIFRVPQRLVETNENACHPQIVSIGPYHHGDPKLCMIQEHKGRFLHDLLARAAAYPSTGSGSGSGITLRDLFETIHPMEKSIRESYSEDLNFNSHELIEMMVLDGCFIIELFCKVERHLPHETDEPLFKIAWVLPVLVQDLLKLENQIPYFVLKALFDRIVIDHDRPSLAKLALMFFNYWAFQRPVAVLERYYDHEGKHILDLFRQTCLPPKQEILQPPTKVLQLIQPATHLQFAGFKFIPKEADSYFDIDFRDGVLEIPLLTIDDFSSSLLINFVAYEQSYSDSSNCITAYVTFMSCLINTSSDVKFLRNRRILENLLTDDDEVIGFFYKVGKDVVFDIDRCYLSAVFKEMSEYYRKDWKVQWSAFKHTYQLKLAAGIILILTMIQTILAILTYIQPSKNNS